MGLKEIITYAGAIIGIAIVCYIRVHFAKRQMQTPDNAYTPKEKKILYLGYAILAVSFVLACIPIY